MEQSLTHYNHQKLPTIASGKLLTEQSLSIGAWAKNEIEKSFANSLSEKRIRNYNNQDMGKLLELIGEWRYLLGVSSQVSERELIIITKFIAESFSNLTYTDIKTTMMMALQGKLDIPFTPMVNFSAKYLSDAISDYLYKKSQFINSAAEKQHKKELREQAEKQTPYTPKQKMTMFADIIKSIHHAANTHQEIIDFNGRIYKWLRNTKQIKLNQQDIDNAMKYGQHKYHKLYGYANAKDANKKDEMIKKYGRENVVVKYFLSTPLTQILSYLREEDFA